MMAASKEVEGLVRGYLSSVQKHLHGMSAQDKRELLADLESHIYEALEQQAGGRQPTRADATGVLAEMDPPESYGQSQNGLASARTRKWNLGTTALCGSLGALVLAALTAMLGGGHSGMPYLLFAGGQIGGFALGVLSWARPLGKAAVCTSALLLAIHALFMW